jgi:Domain of unknown function (DUF4396)
MNKLAFSATVHCLTGCAIGEVLEAGLTSLLFWGSLAFALAVAFAAAFPVNLYLITRVRGSRTAR